MTVTRLAGLLLLVSFLAPGPLLGEPTAPAVADPLLVVLATTTTPEDGRREALRAGDRLGFVVALDTLAKPPLRRVYVGHVITLNRTERGEFAVVSFLGDRADADFALATARKFYPNARAVQTVLPKDANEDWAGTPTARFGILIVGTFDDFSAARGAAETFAKSSGLPFASRGMVLDEKRGLIWPDKFEDAMWAGSYSPRRFDGECAAPAATGCVTVERSEAYDGFSPGHYIVVAGVLDKDGDRQGRLAAARAVVPDAYIKQTTLYLGCVH